MTSKLPIQTYLLIAVILTSMIILYGILGNHTKEITTRVKKEEFSDGVVTTTQVSEPDGYINVALLSIGSIAAICFFVAGQLIIVSIKQNNRD